MGQYFKVLNLDKKEYLHPHCCGDGLKLMEFGASPDGTMLGLALLLRQSTGSGGGDFHGTDGEGLLGRWAGDRVAIVGDYDESGLYDETETWLNISHGVVALMEQDEYVLQERQGNPYRCPHLREVQRADGVQ